MKFVVDRNLSPLVAKGLREAGHDAAHTIDLGFERAADTDVLLRARSEERTVVSADTDFGALLAESGAATPSVIAIRRTADRSASRLLRVLLANLPAVADALNEGAIVVFDADRVRFAVCRFFEKRSATHGQLKRASSAPLAWSTRSAALGP